MSQGYFIPLGVDTQSAETKIDKLVAKIEDAAKAAKNIDIRGGSGHGGGFGGGSGGSGSGGRSYPSNPNNPWDRLERAGRYGPYQTHGQDKAAQLERVRAQKAVDRAEKELNPQASDPLKTMFMRTRLKIGPWHPLVGDLVKNGLLDETKIDGMMAKIGGSSRMAGAAARIAGMAVPMLLGAAGVAAGVGVAASLVEGFASSQRGLSSAYWAGGGSRNLGAAIGVGGFMGMNPGQTGQFANDFGDRLRAGGYGSAQMRAGGVMDFGRYTLNKFDNLVKAMDLLRKMDEKKAIMVARDLGISDMLSIRDLSDGTYQRLKNSGAIGNSPQARRDEAEYRANKEIIGNWWDAAVRSAGGAITGRLVNPWRWSPVGEAIDSFQKSYDMIKGWMGGESQTSSSKDENTKAIQDLTRTMKDHAEVLGGGARRAGAMPVGIKGMQLEQNMNGYSQMLGCFSV